MSGTVKYLRAGTGRTSQDGANVTREGNTTCVQLADLSVGSSAPAAADNNLASQIPEEQGTCPATAKTRNVVKLFAPLDEQFELLLINNKSRLRCIPCSSITNKAVTIDATRINSILSHLGLINRDKNKKGKF
jgi:hypothetical protein